MRSKIAEFAFLLCYFPSMRARYMSCSDAVQERKSSYFNSAASINEICLKADKEGAKECTTTEDNAENRQIVRLRRIVLCILTLEYSIFNSYNFIRR